MTTPTASATFDEYETRGPALAQVSPDMTFTLVRDGDHRLSRPEDLRRLTAMVEELVQMASRS